jgi:hypothetical protein
MFESSHLIFMPAVSPRISGLSGALVAMMFNVSSVSLEEFVPAGRGVAASP